jgi:outer membrane protein assembly factor BamB
LKATLIRASGIVLGFLLVSVRGVASADSWPQFRGPEGQGHSAAIGLPLKWSQSESVAWKVPIPGVGFSSPVIEGEEIWLTAARDEGHTFRAVGLNKTTGKLIHDVLVATNDKPGRVHPTNSPASPTPILDNDRIYVHFGANGTACLTTSGKILWMVKLPHLQAYGPSSTPILYQDLLIVPCHGTDVRYLVALDKKTGKQRWKIDHQGRCSESTPLVIHTPSGDELIYNAAERVVAIEPLKGTALWTVEQGDNFAQIPRPVFGHGMVYVCGGYYAPIVQAIRPGGRGDVTKTHVQWSLRHSSVPLNPSPLVVGKEFYMVSDNGIASCLDALTGKLHWRERIGGTYYASPLAVDGRIYFFDAAGTTTVIRPSIRFEVLAINKLDEKTMASPAIVDKAIYLRTASRLYRLENTAVAKK